MRKLFLLIFLFTFQHSFATIHYIAVSGNNSTGTGADSTHAWATLSYALNHVTASGDVVYVTRGTYAADNTQGVLSVGVSIDASDSASTHIVVTYVGGSTTSAYIQAVSGTANTNGNQFIRNLTFDGNSLTGDRCIYFNARSNVSIYNCRFINFIAFACSWRGTTGSYGTQPSAYAKNDQFYNCSIYNCCGTHASYPGALVISGTDSFQIYNCTMVDTSRTKGNNGNIIGATEGYNRGMQYYGNTTYKPNNDSGNAYNASLEFWNCYGDMNFHDNNFYGGGYMIDEGGSYNLVGPNTPYSFWVHHNNFIQSAQTAQITGTGGVALDNEGYGNHTLFDSNYVQNLSQAVAILSGYTNNSKNSYDTIEFNTFQNCGFSDNSNTQVINIGCYQNSSHAIGDTIQNIYIYYNTFSGSTGTGQARSTIMLQNDSTANLFKNIFIINNIIDSASITFGPLVFWPAVGAITNAGVIDSIYWNNNVVFGNANANAPLYRTGLGGALDRTTSNTHLITNSYIGSAPLFMSSTNYNLQAASPARNAAVNYGHTDIGAYQYINPGAGETMTLYGNWKVAN